MRLAKAKPKTKNKMGVDLRLLPQYSQSNSCDFSHDILEMNRDNDLFDLVAEIEKKKGVEIRKGGINSFSGRDKTGAWEESCYAKTETSEYGNRLKSLPAGELNKVFSEYVPQHGNDWRNEAVFAFMKALPNDLPVYLYWH